MGHHRVNRLPQQMWACSTHPTRLRFVLLNHDKPYIQRFMGAFMHKRYLAHKASTNLA